MSLTPGPLNIGQSLNEALNLQRAGQLREAEKIYARVLKFAPDNFDALNLLGSVKARLGDLNEAARLLGAAVKINARVPQAWFNLGQALYMLKRYGEALSSLDKARALAPDDIATLDIHANVLLSLGRPGDALAEFEQVLARAPNNVQARVNCGIAQAALGFPQAALAEFDRAVALAPGHAIVHFSRGLTLNELGRYADAVAATDAAVAAMPQHAGAWLLRGRALAAQTRFEDAIASYCKALALRKDYADAEFMTSLALLTCGDYARGFEKYEWRWRRTGMPAQQPRKRPLWLGEYPLARKTILLHAEQGLGDTIMFSRYAPLLAAGGAKVVLEVQAELKPLLARLDGAATVIAPGEAPLPFDVHCPLGSLPLALKTEPGTVSAQIPYLTADPAHLEKWSARIGALPRPRIAIAWSGNPSHDNDRNRSIAFARLAPLFPPLHPLPLAGEERVGASFVSIQRDVRGEDAAPLASEARVTHVGGELQDFSDTAAVLAQCDLVIAVDTAAAHLAGAMGRPLWVLLPFWPDWRWTRDGETTPWYPAARLFRQTAHGDWDGVIARVAAELDAFKAPA
jgi:tetratricopeptide (TPR) repeat protein